MSVEDYLATPEMRTLQEHIDELTSQLSESQTVVVQLQQQVWEGSVELSRVQAEAATAEEALRARLGKREEEAAYFRTLIADRGMDLSDLRGVVATRDAELQTLQDQLAAIELRASDAERLAPTSGDNALLTQVLSQSLKEAREEAKLARDDARAVREELRAVERGRDVLKGQIWGFEMAHSSHSRSATARHHSRSEASQASIFFPGSRDRQ